MRGYKIKCPKCGKNIGVSFATTKPLWEPIPDIDYSMPPTAKRIQCPHCYLCVDVIPKTIEEFCSPQPPNCLHCGKNLTTEDNLVVLHTLASKKPAVYEYAGYKDGEPVYRRVSEPVPETERRYFFCSIKCYYDFLDNYGLRPDEVLLYIDY